MATEIEIVFFGDDMYWRSSTFMSSLYTADGQRYDYGFLGRDLAAGHEVHIRQATPEEQQAKLAQLASLNARLEKI